MYRWEEKNHLIHANTFFFLLSVVYDVDKTAVTEIRTKAYSNDLRWRIWYGKDIDMVACRYSTYSSPSHLVQHQKKIIPATSPTRIMLKVVAAIIAG